MYLEGATPRTWRVHTVCVYILKVYISFFLLFLLEVYKGNAWTKNNNRTKPSFGSGQSRRGPDQIYVPVVGWRISLASFAQHYLSGTIPAQTARLSSTVPLSHGCSAAGHAPFLFARV